MDLHETWIDCDCHSPNHAVKFWIDSEDRFATMSVQLLPARNPFKRLWLAVRYAVGWPYKWGEFDDFVIGPSNVEALQGVLDRVRATYDDTNEGGNFPRKSTDEGGG